MNDFSVTMRWPIIRRNTRKTYQRTLKVLRQEPRGYQHRDYQKRVYCHGEPLPLVVEGRGKLVGYACHNCGRVASVKYDNNSPGRAYAIALECCRRPHRCRQCNTPMSHDSTCRVCSSKSSYLNNRNRARKAEIIADDGNPVWCNWSNGQWGEGYSSDLDSHLEAWNDDHAPESRFISDEKGDRWEQVDKNAKVPLPPPFVFSTSPITPEIDLEHVFESISENQHDDFDTADMPGVDEVTAAVEAFNKRQSATSHEIDYSRVIVIDPERFKAYLETDWNGLPDIHYRASADPVGIPQHSERTHEPHPHDSQ